MTNALVNEVTERQLQDTIVRMAKLLGWSVPCARDARNIKEFGIMAATKYDAPAVLDIPRRVTPKGLASMPHKDTVSPSKFIRRTPGQVEVPCSYCGRPMFVAPSRLRYYPRQYCDRACRAMHMTAPAEDRFWQKVRKSDSGCWEWTGGLSTAGYGSFNAGGRPARYVAAHQFSYELHVGSVPDGLELDHTCRNRACVNPAHLEPVTHKVNVYRGMAPSIITRRSGTCANGHPRTPENIYHRKDRPGAIECLACRRERRKRGGR